MMSRRSFCMEARRSLTWTFTFVFVLAQLCQSASAASFYWSGDHDVFWNSTGGAAGTNWSSSPDFNNGTGGTPGSADDVFFVLFGSNASNTQLGLDFQVRTLTFTPDAVTL